MRVTSPPKYEAYKVFRKGMEYYEVDNVPFREYMNKAISIDSNYFELLSFFSLFLLLQQLQRESKGTTGRLHAVGLICPADTLDPLSTSRSESSRIGNKKRHRSGVFSIIYSCSTNTRTIATNGFWQRPLPCFPITWTKPLKYTAGPILKEWILASTWIKEILYSFLTHCTKKGEYQKILDLSDQYLKDYPDYFYLLIAHINLGNETAADELFTTLDLQDDELLRRPKAYYYNIIGREYLKLNQPNRAKLCQQKSMKFAPNLPNAINFERIFSLFYLKNTKRESVN